MTHYHSIHLACPQAVCGDIGIVVTLEVCKSVEAVWTSAGKGVLVLAADPLVAPLLSTQVAAAAAADVLTWVCCLTHHIISCQYHHHCKPVNIVCG